MYVQYEWRCSFDYWLLQIWFLVFFISLVWSTRLILQTTVSGNVLISTKMTEGFLKNTVPLQHCLCVLWSVMCRIMCLFAFSLVCVCVCSILFVYLISATKPLTCKLSQTPPLSLILFNYAVCTGYSFIFPPQYRDYLAYSSARKKVAWHFVSCKNIYFLLI